ncbi:HIT family protein [Legionella sp. W05-934-2]|uniref:HIT family protein n=1 Tax=Legionella sp. W05-934-2 TaxID=1198649 RepID=UPI003462B09B
MATLFTKIIQGEIPCYKVAETDKFLAFLDINPNSLGHTLCIPKWEVNHLFDMGDEDYLGLMQFAKGVAKGLRAVIACERIGMAVVGLEVPHVHVHLIPLHTMADMRFDKKVSLSKEEFEQTASKLNKVIVGKSYVA